jgi:hypothetical protein
MSLETIMVKAARARATPRNVSARAKRAPVDKTNIPAPEPAPRHTPCPDHLELRLGAPAFLCHLQELRRKLSDLAIRPLPSGTPASDEFNAMVTETRVLFSLYAELGRQLATLDLSAADQSLHTGY